MKQFIPFLIVTAATVLPGTAGCGTGIPVDEAAAELAAPDGIDPQNPYIERTTTMIDFAGVRTIRIEIPLGRLSLSQANSDGPASLRVKEEILVKGLSNEVLAEKHSGSAVSAERSFVDAARLDIKAAVADGLANTDIAFDVRLVIPSAANIEVIFANGQVEVTNVTGNVEIHTGNGDITVSGITGSVIAVTTLRPINIADVTGNVLAETTEADIGLRLAPPSNGAVSATTTQGLIRLTIAQTTAATLNLSAPEGTITTNLAGFSVSNLTTGNGFLTGVLNGGGGRIDALARKGEIEFVGM